MSKSEKHNLDAAQYACLADLVSRHGRRAVLAAVNEIFAQKAATATVIVDDLIAVSVARFAQITSISRAQLYVEAKEGRLRLTKVGGRTLVMLDDGKAWLRAHQDQQAR